MSLPRWRVVWRMSRGSGSMTCAIATQHNYYSAESIPEVAQERPGHSSVSITFDPYSHVPVTMREDAAAKLDMAFKTAITTAAPRPK